MQIEYENYYDIKSIDTSSLTNSQLQVVREFQNGIHPNQRVAICGSAGTGKTYLLDKVSQLIIRGMYGLTDSDLEVEKKPNWKLPKGFMLLGPTGISVETARKEISIGNKCNFSTIARYFYRCPYPLQNLQKEGYITEDGTHIKITLSNFIEDIISGQVWKKYPDIERYASWFFPDRAKLVIIDEVSMVHHKFIEFLCQMHDAIEPGKKSKPHLIFVGDLYQLPAIDADLKLAEKAQALHDEAVEEGNVANYINPEHLEELKRKSKVTTSPQELQDTFQKNNVKILSLKESVRCKDENYIRMLNSVRRSNLDLDLLTKNIEVCENFETSDEYEMIRVGHKKNISDTHNGRVHTAFSTEVDEEELELLPFISNVKGLPEDVTVFERLWDIYIRAEMNMKEAHRLAKGKTESSLLTAINNKVASLYSECNLTKAIFRACPSERVMVRKNYYQENASLRGTASRDLKYANGTIDRLENIDLAARYTSQEFQFKHPSLKSKIIFKLSIPVLSLTYAINAHKTQGASYGEVKSGEDNNITACNGILIDYEDIVSSSNFIDIAPLVYVALSRKKGGVKVYFTKKPSQHFVDLVNNSDQYKMLQAKGIH